MGMNKEKPWWYPVETPDGDLEWLCDNLGDAIEVMDKLWSENRDCQIDNERLTDLIDNLKNGIEEVLDDHFDGLPIGDGYEAGQVLRRLIDRD